jgi:hypothetical protein
LGFGLLITSYPVLFRSPVPEVLQLAPRAAKGTAGVIFPGSGLTALGANELHLVLIGRPYLLRQILMGMAYLLRLDGVAGLAVLGTKRGVEAKDLAGYPIPVQVASDPGAGFRQTEIFSGLCRRFDPA